MFGGEWDDDAGVGDLGKDIREKEIIHEIIDAIKNEGPNPEHHRIVLKRHVEEWPTLWNALYKLLTLNK